MICPRPNCGGQMKPSTALIPTSVAGEKDFISGDVVTMSIGGPGKLIDCLKCERCGHSVTAELGKEMGK